MASDTFTFIGQATKGWFRYRDAVTGSMLVAEPGGTYQIQALEPDLPVPPEAQLWVPGTAKAAADTSKTAPASAPGGDI